MSKYLNGAINGIKNMSVNKVFLVRDLFDKYDWDLMNLNEKKDLGKKFYLSVEYRTDIVILEKANGIQAYKRIK